MELTSAEKATTVRALRCFLNEKEGTVDTLTIRDAERALTKIEATLRVRQENET